MRTLTTSSQRRWLLFLYLGALLGCSSCSSDFPGTSDNTIPYLATPETNVMTGGQPSPEQFRTLAANGLVHVINLRPQNEMGKFDEQTWVLENEMSYSNIPISSSQDLNRTNVAAFDQLLDEYRQDQVLVHCKSSNRVGALAALRAKWVQNKTTKEAITIGRAWGLSGLERDVHKIIAAGEK